MLELALTTHPGHLTMLGVSLLVGVIWSAAILAPTEPTEPGSVESGSVESGSTESESTESESTESESTELRSTRPMPREALVCVGVVVIAVFAAALWLGRSSALLAGDVFARLDLPWLAAPGALAAEQARGGAVALFIVVPACAVLAVVVSLRARGRTT
jgi:putative copper resistance protein D